jgi:signal transduction histidine kinase
MNGRDAFMIRWLPLTILLLACFSQGARAADGALFLNGEDFQDLEGHLSLWRDPSKAATLQEALAAQEAGAFSPIPGNLGLGYVPEAAWLTFSLRVPEGPVQDRWLELAPPYIDRFDLYHFDPAGVLDHRTGGDIFPLSNRELVYRNHVFRLALAPGEHQFFIRVEAKGLIAAIVKIWTRPALDARFQFTYFRAGVYFGFLLAALLGAVALAITLRDGLVFLFAGSILSHGLNNSSIWGLLNHLVLPQDPALADQLTGLFALSVSLTAWWFFARLLELRRYHPWFYRVSQGGVVFSMAALLLSPFGYYQTLSFWVQLYALLFIGGAPFVALRLWRQGDTLDRFLALAYLSVICCLILTMLLSLGVLPFSEALAYAQATTAVVYVGMFSAYLLFKAAESQRTLAQAEAEHGLFEERTRLLQLIAHELRTPVAKIDAARQVLELLERTPDATPEARQPRLAAIRQATERLKLLFTLTLDRERKEEVGGPPSTLTVDLLLKDLEALCGPVLRERLRIDFAAPEAQVRADAREVGFALLNLVEGMAKATPRDSALTLRVSGERSERGAPQVLFIFTAPLSQEGERFSGTTFVRSVFEACGGGFRWLPAEEGMQCVQLWLPEALQQ